MSPNRITQLTTKEKIEQRLEQIRFEKNHVPKIDFNLKLDRYHIDDNCLHCKSEALKDFTFDYKNVQKNSFIPTRKLSLKKK